MILNVHLLMEEKNFKNTWWKQYNYADPLNLFNDYVNLDIKENNFTPLFFEYDTNHPNAKGNILMSLSLLETIYDNEY